MNGVIEMNKFIDNVNTYLRDRHINNNYVSLMTGWEKSKVSRILSGESKLKYEDMEIIADALGRDVVFFMSDIESLLASERIGNEQIAFFAGQFTNEMDKQTANDLVDMFRFYDALTLLNV